MANHKSAEKRIRQTRRRTIVNTTRKSRVRSSIKTVETAIAAGDKDAAVSALKVAQPEMHRGAAKGIVPRNMVARKLSRLAKRINAL